MAHRARCRRSPQCERRVVVAGTNYTGSVTLSVSGLPAGVTSSWNNAVIGGGSGTRVLTLTAAADAPVVSDVVITITATGTGVAPDTAVMVLNVTAAGPYEWLRPKYTLPWGLNGIRLLFDANTGDIIGTTVDTTEPTWATTVAVTDSGDADQNRIALQAAIDGAFTSATGHTRILIAAGFAGDNRIIFPCLKTPYTWG